MSQTRTTGVEGQPRLILRLEGFAMAAAGTAIFIATGTSWWLFLALAFLPDVSFAAYARGPVVGAFAYNAFHSTTGALVLAGLGWFMDAPSVVAAGGVWLVHVGFDRTLGHGLKYPSDFHSAHLGRIGSGR